MLEPKTKMRIPACVLALAFSTLGLSACQSSPDSGDSVRLAPTFASSADTAQWDFTPASWSISDGALHLDTAGVPSGPIRKPAARAILHSQPLGNFVLTADVRAEAPVSLLGRDVIIYFGYQSPTRFYYAHLSNQTSAPHNGIFLVNDADRVRIDDGKAPPRLNDAEWHQVRVERDVDSGSIKVYLDDMSTPLLQATDTTLRAGRVGFGSFDDTGSFRNLEVEGEARDPSTIVYIGTFTDSVSQGIYGFKLDPVTAQMQPLGLMAEASNPGFLALDPTRQFLYSVNPDGQNVGAVSSFSIEPGSGKLTLLNTVSSGGVDPAYISIDGTGKDALVANYGAGSLAVLPILADGTLGEATDVVQHTGSGVNPTRQEGPHAHSVLPSPDNRFILSADLGVDKVFVYRLDTATGKLTPNDPPFAELSPGSGPRHIAFSPDSRHVYVSDELSSSVTVFDYDAETGALNEVETVSTLPAGFKGTNTVSQVAVHPDGKFLYVGNRGHDSVVVYSIDPTTGKLTPVQWVSTEGRVPRHFGIDPTGSVLIAANKNSNSIVVFRIDPSTGEITPTGQKFDVGIPTFVLFLPLS